MCCEEIESDPCVRRRPVESRKTSGPPRKFSLHFQTLNRLRHFAFRFSLHSLMSRISILDCRMQRRNAVRYRLQLPVIFHWQDSKEHTDGGFTKDVGLDGALILSRECPPVGAVVRLELLIPCPVRNGEEVRLECIGTVTRVADEQGRHFFGVKGFFEDNHLSSWES